MAIVSQRKERIKSVILCSDREFKAKAVLLLKGAAFPAEKKIVENIEDAINIINDDKSTINLVIEGPMFSTDTLIDVLQYAEDHNKNPELNILCILDEDQAPNSAQFESIFERTFVECYPLKQAQFNRAFHAKRASKAATTPPSGRKKAQKTPKPALSTLEASKHLTETVDMINHLTKDRSNIEKVINIGQRFNGLIGAFQFFGSKQGYPQLKELAEMIDAIGRTYEVEEVEEIAEEHLQFLRDAARCSYLILKDLRENSQVDSTHLEKYQCIEKQFKNFENLRLRENLDQQSIDDMIEQQLSKSS